MIRPFLDAFGTRIDPAELARGLEGFGLTGMRLVVGDQALVLEFPEAEMGSEAAARATTWVRGVFSPLLPVEVQQAPVEGIAVDDARQLPPIALAVAEVTALPAGIDAGIDTLLDRLGAIEGRSGPGPAAPPVDDPGMAGRLGALAGAWGARLEARGIASGGASFAWLERGKLLGAVSGSPALLAWQRPGGRTGVRPALILAAGQADGLRWLVEALIGRPRTSPAVLVDGLVWGVGRRPTIAAPPREDGFAIDVDPGRCTSCGQCARVCPTDAIGPEGRPTDDADACIRCYDCVTTCPEDALRPTEAADTAMRGDLPSIAEGWLSRLAGRPGPAVPSPFPPSYLQPVDRKPRVVLGLAVMTQMEHAAALIVDGKLVGAVEEEKLVRIRHYGWTPPYGPRMRNLSVDPTLTLEQVLCRRSIRVLLAEAGLTLDDVDVFALNGLPSRYRALLPVLDADQPIPAVRSGRVLALPHHLCHAASAFRLSGLDKAWVFTVDGRGDRETAAIFRAEDGEIVPVHTLLSLTDRSIGGVYETITRLLGFGTHGQGSVMALAAFGTPGDALEPWLSARSWGDVRIHEGGLAAAKSDLERGYDDPITQAHKDLAATVQAALERTVLTLVGEAAGDTPDALCLAGGVTLNCKANDLLRTTFRPAAIFAQPGANDGGTALGAAAEGWHRIGGAPLPEMTSASLGPQFDEGQIREALVRAGVAFVEVEDIAEAVAERVVEGKVVCWFQGRLEYGPRALGARSIVADPRKPEIHGRVNGIKQRQSWRPFGPSILAGHEYAWFEDAFDARFMLFTTQVRAEKREKIPAVVHVDGSTRPQVVHADDLPLYHRMIAAFHARTGVPMVLNTSFNRRGEPIVCTPRDALESFAGLGADLLAIGPFLVEAGARLPAPSGTVDHPALAELPGGRRLSLRLTVECDLACVHCTLRDHVGPAGVSTEGALLRLAEGRKAGCDELVILRGEATLRRDLPLLVKQARAMGYRFVQLQTHGRALANPAVLNDLRSAGIDAFEVMLLAADALHDRLADRPGALRDTLAGLQRAVASRADVLLTMPLLRANAGQVGKVLRLAAKIGIRRVQLQFPRPIELSDGVPTGAMLRLATAAGLVRRALPVAGKLRIQLLTEGIPLCLLPEALHGSPDATEDFGRHRIDDLGLVHDRFDTIRAEMRPEAEPCRTCAVADRCPKTWALYLELFGTAELSTLSALSGVGS